MSDVLVCPECGEEYRSGFEVCADCGTPLQRRPVGGDGRAILPPREEDGPPDLTGYRTIFVSSGASDLVPLGNCLREAGLPFAFREGVSDEGAAEPNASDSPVFPGVAMRAAATRRSSQAPKYRLLVPSELSAQALQLIAPLLDADADPEQLGTIESEFEAGRYRRCPACSTELAVGAVTCPECGLGLSPSCPGCGAEIAPDDTACPGCGRAIEE
jgi:Double zinc ribbon